MTSENTTNAAKPLKVSITNRPPMKQGGIGNDIAIEKGASIVRDVLEHLKYDGTWTLAFVRQTKKRFNIKFQVSRREGPRSILIRTKPFDNGSCWESILTPPEKYDPSEVMTMLEQVHPTRLEVKRLTNADIQKVFSPIQSSIRQQFSPDPRKKLRDIIMTCAGEHKQGFKLDDLMKPFKEVAKTLGGMKPHEEREIVQSIKTNLNILVSAGLLVKDEEGRYGKPSEFFPKIKQIQPPTTILEKIKLEKAELNEVDREIENRLKQKEVKPETKPKTIEAVEEIVKYDFTLSPDSSVPLHRNKDAIFLALMSLYLTMGDDKRRNITPGEITRILSEKMNLGEYVENQDHYRKIPKTASSLTKGMVDEGYLEREHCVGDSTHTKYVTFTIKGIDACKGGMSQIQQEIRPQPVALQPVLQPVAAKPVEPANIDGATIEQNMDDLQPLAKELESLKNSILTYDDIERQTQLDLNTTLDAISGLQSRIREITSQLNSLNERMDTYKSQETQFNNDLQDVKLNKDADRKRMDEIKLKIRAILRLES